MDTIDRRSALRGILCVAVAAGFGATALPDMAEASSSPPPPPPPPGPPLGLRAAQRASRLRLAVVTLTRGSLAALVP